MVCVRSVIRNEGEKKKGTGWFSHVKNKHIALSESGQN